MKKNTIINGVICFLILLLFASLGSGGSKNTNEQTSVIENVEEVEISDNKVEVTEQPIDEIQEEITVEELAEVAYTEEEYKENCKELWYDDIFFSKNNLESEYVKLDLFVEESRFFTMDASYNSNTADFMKNFSLQRDFYKCGVMRKDENSYVGSQIELFFSDDYDCESSDIECGNHIIVYGQIIDYSTNTVDGYNSCSVIPKYIEIIE